MSKSLKIEAPDKQPPNDETTLTAFEETDQLLDGDRQVYFVELAGPNMGQVIVLDKKDTIIGRDDNADIQFTDAGISRKHAAVSWSSMMGTFIIRDLGSRNGTIFNGLKIDHPTELRAGDKIKLGMQTVLRVSYGDEVETKYANAMFSAALMDALTGVYNRRYFDDRLSEEIAYAVRHTSPLTLLFLDIDHFKRINDDYEHRCGDAVLKQLAGRLSSHIRAEDTLARYGGEEFAIICCNITEDQGAILAERLRTAVVKKPFLFERLSLKVMVSIGVATTGEEIRTEESLISAADKALLIAKESGRNRVVKYSVISS